MKTKIKAKNILEQASIICALTGVYNTLRIEIRTTDYASYITVMNKEIYTLDIIKLLESREIHTDIYYKINGKYCVTKS